MQTTVFKLQNKLLLKHGVLIVIGYSFSDEHINNAIYAALASNSTLSVIIFGNYHPSENLTKLTDRRIYQISGAIDITTEDGRSTKEKIHYFNYIVNHFIADLDRNKDEEILEEFIKSVKSLKDKK